jgi:hypothetical protein
MRPNVYALGLPKQSLPSGVHAKGLSVRYSFAVCYGCCAGEVWGKGLRTVALILALLSLLGIVACSGSSSSSTVTAVTVTCTPTSVQSGQTSSCTATITGTGAFNTAVSWGVTAGTVDTNGLFTAPAVNTNTAVSVSATSIQDTTQVGSASITVTPVTAITVTCSPTAIQPRQTSQCIATANGSGTTTVNWTSSIGSISVAGLFTAPQVTSSTQATITATTQVSIISATSSVMVNVNNTAPLVVDGGPTVGGVSVGYPNGAYATVTVCTPGTTTCQSVDHVLVDTGSEGLRVLSSALGGVSLPAQSASDGNPLAECYVRPDGYAWGPVALAQVQVAGEIATSIPVQVIAPASFTAAPPSCITQTTGGALNTVTALKANGVLGIGVFVQDCGTACATSTPPPNTYYSCPSSGCGAIQVATSQQLTNPITMFPNDNNGSLIQLPPVFSGGSPTAQGSLIFGIGTQSNNGLLTATIYGVTTAGLNPGSFVSTYSSNAYPGSISSGANANYFLNATITGYPACATTGYYCPSSDQTLSVTNAGTNGTNGSVSLTVSNADTLLGSSNKAFSNLAGPGSGRTGGFLFGVPFFYGRTVYTAINGAGTPGGIGPYFAY